jgi:hypothetical protein
MQGHSKTMSSHYSLGLLNSSGWIFTYFCPSQWKILCPHIIPFSLTVDRFLYIFGQNQPLRKAVTPISPLHCVTANPQGALEQDQGVCLNYRYDHADMCPHIKRFTLRDTWFEEDYHFLLYCPTNCALILSTHPDDHTVSCLHMFNIVGAACESRGQVVPVMCCSSGVILVITFSVHGPGSTPCRESWLDQPVRKW